MACVATLVRLLTSLYSRTATRRVCADGGANRLMECCDAAMLERNRVDAIIGDLDSVQDDVQRYFMEKVCP